MFLGLRRVGDLMAKKTNTAERDRFPAAEDEAQLREHLERAGSKVIHTVNSIAWVLFGCDGPFPSRQRKAARRWMEKLRKLRYPVFPCDASGTVISDTDANKLAKRGFKRHWRYLPDGRFTSELGETLDAKGRAEWAEGVVACEESDPPRVFEEPRLRLLEGIKSLLRPDELRAAKQRFDVSNAASVDRHRGSLVNQLSRTIVAEPSEDRPPRVNGCSAESKVAMQFQRKLA